jgi:hypothetical protein
MWNSIQLPHLNEINMMFYGAEYNNIERGDFFLKYFAIFEMPWKFWIFKKKIEIIRKFWNWNFKKKLNFKFIFFLISLFWKFWNFKFFSNILISKKQFLCNKKPYCTLVPRNFIHLFCTRVQYDYLLHRNCFLLINMLENGMSRVLLLANRKTVK